MQLDSARNHIILVNLWISVASISLMVAAMPSAFFGMNVQHGLEVGGWVREWANRLARGCGGSWTRDGWAGGLLGLRGVPSFPLSVAPRASCRRHRCSVAPSRPSPCHPCGPLPRTLHFPSLPPSLLPRPAAAQEVRGAFPVVVALSVGLAVGSFPFFMRYFTDRFLRQNRQDTRNLMMLR